MLNLIKRNFNYTELFNSSTLLCIQVVVKINNKNSNNKKINKQTKKKPCLFCNKSLLT